MGGDSATPLTWAEIAAWASLASRAPTPDEVDSLRLLDLALLSVLKGLSNGR
jgi:hypothetical protein